MCLDSTDLRTALAKLVKLSTTSQLVDDKCLPYSIKGLEDDSSCGFRRVLV